MEFNEIGQKYTRKGRKRDEKRMEMVYQKGISYSSYIYV